MHRPSGEGLLCGQFDKKRRVEPTMRILLLFLASLMISSGHARAEGCPDFFRFVDFGLDTPDGAMRGGPTYRAEGFDGQALLIRDLTVCRDVRSVAVDGHGNPIPIVESVHYNPEFAGVDLKDLRLIAVDDIAAVAERNAAEHRARLTRDTMETRRGPDYLCASQKLPNAISCQFVSPFGGNLPLVVYCDPVSCRMPSLAVNEKVIADVNWLPSDAMATDHDAMVLEMADKVQQVHDFLAPLSSWTPDFKRFDP